MKSALLLISVLLGIFPYHGSALRGLGGSVKAAWTDYKLMTKVMDPFRREDLGAFSNPPDDFKPSDNPDDVYFYLYNNPSANGQFHEIIWNDCYALNGLPWIKNAPIKILIHGFTQSQNSSMPAMIKNAYLEQMSYGDDYNVNVVAVDWGRLAGSTLSTYVPRYTKAVKNVARAGIRVGELIANLKKCGVVSTMNDIHVVGFSLGAHVAGWAGKTAAELVSPIGRITGLDPAGPLFYANITDFSGRDLTKDDAQWVDVLHTSSGFYGTLKTLGNADFFANLGVSQPYCTQILNTLRPIQVCSHNMAPVYFAMSILKDLYACKCGSVLVLEICRRRCEPASFGEYWETTNTGEYYLAIPSRLLQDPNPPSEVDIANEVDHMENTLNRDVFQQLQGQKPEVSPPFWGVELTPRNSEQVAWIYQHRNIPGLLFWSGAVIANEPVSILVQNTESDKFLDSASKVGIRINGIQQYRVNKVLTSEV